MTPFELSKKLMILLALLAFSGCASTKVTDRDSVDVGYLPRPAHIWVYDFAASASDVPDESVIGGSASEDAAGQTADHLAKGRELGALIATALVDDINKMGMSAEHAVYGSTPQIDDLVLRGYLISYDEGSAAKRVGIGLGDGNSELNAAVEAFQMTGDGLRKLGSADTDATGNKTPGTAVGLAALIATHNPIGLIVSTGLKVHGEESGSDKVEGRAKQTAGKISDELKKRFEQQGWIN